MIRKLLATTAIATVASMGGYAALAQNADSAMSSPMAIEYVEMQGEHSHLASDLIGKNVYNSTNEDADTIGEIEDLVVAEDGSIESVIIGIGGFLDIGEKHVAINFESLTWTRGSDDETFLAINATKEELEAAPSYRFEAMQRDSVTSMTADHSSDQPMAQVDATADGQPMSKPMAENEPMKPNTDLGDRPDFAAMEPAPAESINADELLDTVVYGADGANIGEVGDIILTQDGQVDAVVLDVGGFLGIGEKPVAIGFDAIEILANRDGDLVVRTEFTQDELEAAPDYVADEYRANRDSMRLTMVRPVQ